MMTNLLFNGLVTMFTTPKTKYSADMLLWAKIEYGRDWQFAYQCMLETGMPPSRKDAKGITL